LGVLASRSDTVFSLSTGNQEPGTGSILLCFSSILCTERSSVLELARLQMAELAFSKVLPRPQGVLARPIFGRTGIAKRYGVLFIYREPGTGNWEQLL
jgi:hypothetical protein